MASQFNKPENALNRAEELVKIGAKMEALQALHSVITAKKFRSWSPVMEKIMLKYIALCAELRKGAFAKDGLHQFRVICQQYNVASLETVVKFFLQQAEERAKEAQSKADQIVLDIADLEAEESVESLMLSSVSGDDQKDRTDREVVTPWLKFLWETYRTALEILRNNNKLEVLYQETCQQAFNFCLKYKRHTEFRRLSEMLRTHLANIGRNVNQAQSINLSSPETLQLHLDARFAQLNAAVELELWQEAFRSIEDIHGLITLAKNKPKPQVLANYYQKLAQIFWVSENYLFHAFAYSKYVSITKAFQKPSADELKILSSALLLATMAVPLGESQDEIFDFDLQKEKNLRMAGLLTFGAVTMPKRSQLVEELNLKNISTQVLPELSDLYFLMEKKFNPLQLCQSVKPKLDFLAEHPSLKQYAKPLQDLLIIRLLQQLSKVYETMKISEFCKLASFVNFNEIEKLITESVQKKYFDVRIDYQLGVLNFKSQSLESEQLKSQLTQLAKNLQSAVHLIRPERDATYQQKKKEIYQKVLQGLHEEHQRILARKLYIEKRKVEMEEHMKRNLERAEAEKKRQEEAAKEQERIRMAALAAEREKIKRQKELQEKGRKDFENWAKSVKIDPSKVAELIDKNMDPDEFVRSKIMEAEKEQDILAKKMKKIAKTLDWVERAKREEEAPLLKEEYQKQLVKDEEEWHKNMEEWLKAHEANHVKELQEKERLGRMIKDKEKFEERLFKRRQEEYLALKKERDERVALRRQQLEEERAAREKEEAQKRAALKQMEEEKERLRQEEQERLQRENEERLRRREEERLRAQRDLPPRGDGPSRDVAPPRDRYIPPRERERDLPPRDRDFPPRDRDFRDLPPRDRDFPPRDRDFPPRDRDFPPRDRDRDFPPRDRDFRDLPPRGRDFPPPRDRDFPPRDRDRDFPPRDRDFPPRDRDFRDLPPRDRDFPPRDRDLPPRDRDRDFPPRDRDFPPRDRDLPPRDRDLPPRDLPPRDRDLPPRDRDLPPRDRDLRGPPPREEAPSDRDWRSGPRDLPRGDFGRGGRDSGRWGPPPRSGSRDFPPRDGPRDVRRFDDRGPPPRRDEPERSPSDAPSREPAAKAAEEPRKPKPDPFGGAKPRDAPPPRREPEKKEEPKPQQPQQAAEEDDSGDGFTLVKKNRRR